MPMRGAAEAGARSWQGSVADKDLTAPPGSPSTGDRYIVASPATGLWAGEENSIAEWDGVAWIFDTPVGGWAVWVDDETEIYVFNGSSWGQESFGPHAATHQDGGADEINVAALSGELADLQPPKLHATAHQDAGGDEISVAALSGLLADAQTPLSHAATHKGGGADVIDGATGSLAGLMSSVDKAEFDKVSTDWIQVIYVSKKGNDSDSGKTPHEAKLTFGSAITAAGTPADEANAVGIVCLDDGEYNENLFGKAFVNIYAPLATFRVATLTNMPGDCSWTFRRMVSVGRELCERRSGGGPSYLNCEILEQTSSETIDVENGELVVNIGRVISTTGSVIIVGSSGVLRGHIGAIESTTGTLINLVGEADVAITVDHMVTGGSFGIYVSQTGSANAKLRLIVGDLDVTGDAITVVQSGSGVPTVDILAARINAGGLAYNVDDLAVLNLMCPSITGGRTETPGSLVSVNGITHRNVATTDATVTTITTIPIPDDTAVWIEADVEVRRTNASERSKFKRGALIFRESAGAATLEGAVWTPVTIPAATSYDATITVSGNNALIRVTGVAANDLNWQSRHTVAERS